MTVTAASRALRLVVLLGIVSLFADMTYEGARSVTGPFLAILGASGTVVGIVAGAGELVGYGIRLVSGYLADRTGRYWTITLLGYVINLLAVPLLALAGRWELAAGLMIAERLGKAIRNPPRDAMLSHATRRIGAGWAFGLHEALDQLGALVGPFIVTVVLVMGAGYRTAFAVLLVPALLALGFLTTAWRAYPTPRDLEPEASTPGGHGFPRALWIYLAAAAFVAAGYVDFPLIAYHFGKTALFAAPLIPVSYAVAMAVDGLAALAFGRLFDRLGVTALVLSVVLSAAFPLLVFSESFPLALAGMVLWGIGMGAQESIFRAVIARLVPANRRGSAYGAFNTGYGVAWFLGSALMGILYDVSLPALIGFSVAMQLVAIPILLRLRGDVR
ncbi:MAG: MFS transporter [Candidatus Rokubacteria bacterium]|nr:MFS transporter [Candidatus Rokubacteria bacterium]